MQQQGGPGAGAAPGLAGATPAGGEGVTGVEVVELPSGTGRGLLGQRPYQECDSLRSPRPSWAVKSTGAPSPCKRAPAQENTDPGGPELTKAVAGHSSRGPLTLGVEVEHSGQLRTLGASHLGSELCDLQ